LSVSTSPINSAVGSAALLVTVEEVSRDIFGGGVFVLVVALLWISFSGWPLLLTAASSFPSMESFVTDIARVNCMYSKNVRMTWLLKRLKHVDKVM
jgi:hypothetical protein